MNQTVLITGACINTGVDIVKLFAQKGWNIVFTGRTQRNVCAMQREYEQEFPNARIYGYTLNSLIDERTVNEEGVEKMFENLDGQGVTVNAVVLNAADQGLGIKIFENPLTDFMKVINTNICWNYCDAWTRIGSGQIQHPHKCCPSRNDHHESLGRKS